MRCDIVIATWNAVDMTRTALASIQREANFPYRLIIVDNSDEEEARRHFRLIADTAEFGETLLIQNETNIGWLKATNIGLRHVDADYVCLLNNDVICGTDWLRRCVDLLEREPDIGLLNPRGNERSENRRVKDINAYALSLAAQQGALHTELDCCSGYCMVAPARIFREVGLLDEIFDRGYYEDLDFSRRVRQAGYRCAQCDDAYVLHLGSQSFKKVPEGPKRAMKERNRQICEGRWGVLRRQLLLVEAGDIDADTLLDLLRRTRLYLVVNDRVPERVLNFRHDQLILLRPGWLGASLYFSLQCWYLSRKARIDEARVIYAGPAAR